MGGRGGWVGGPTPSVQVLAARSTQFLCDELAYLTLLAKRKLPGGLQFWDGSLVARTDLLQKILGFWYDFCGL